jgi:hypothetical protein
MSPRAALDLCGDHVDLANIYLDRIKALATAIHIGCNEGLAQDDILVLASIVEDEAHRAQAELEAWFDGLMKEDKR